MTDTVDRERRHHDRMNKAHVMVVDDSRTARTFFSRAVSYATDLPIIDEETAEHALETLKSGVEIATIILDHHLPGMNGLDLLRIIQHNEEWRRIPVLVTTASAYDETLVSECISLGAADFMEKKYLPEIFKARIRRSIQSYYTQKQSDELRRQLADAVESQRQLLDNTLPDLISRELMETGRFRPLQRKDAAVIFIDVCGFTNFTKNHSSIKLVSNLNRLIKRLERISDEYGLEKIKTIGDAYMAVSGVLEEGYSLTRVLDSAFQAIRETRELEIGWEIKVGVATGPLVGGIIGEKRIQFDVWGNTVNMAARMCNAAGPGLVALPKDQFVRLDSSPPIVNTVMQQVKGIGEVEVVILKPPEELI